jgi:hypothetical protein
MGPGVSNPSGPLRTVGFKLDTPNLDYARPAWHAKSGKIVEHAPWPDRNSGDHFQIVAALDDTLHVIGGLDGETFDPSQKHWTWRDGNWSRQRDAPETMFAKLSVVQTIENRLYVLGPDHSLVFDAEINEWRRLAPMPETLVMPGSYVQNGVIHVLGGLATQVKRPRMCYDPQNDRWWLPEKSP